MWAQLTLSLCLRGPLTLYHIPFNNKRRNPTSFLCLFHAFFIRTTYSDLFHAIMHTSRSQYVTPIRFIRLFLRLLLPCAPSTYLSQLHSSKSNTTRTSTILTTTCSPCMFDCTTPKIMIYLHER